MKAVYGIDIYKVWRFIPNILHLVRQWTQRILQRWFNTSYNLFFIKLYIAKIKKRHDLDLQLLTYFMEIVLPSISLKYGQCSQFLPNSSSPIGRVPWWQTTWKDKNCSCKIWMVLPNWKRFSQTNGGQAKWIAIPRGSWGRQAIIRPGGGDGMAYAYGQCMGCGACKESIRLKIKRK